MAKTKKLSGKEEVDQFIEKLTHPLLDVIKEVREIIMGADTNIGEHIKWNAPAFYYTGEMKPYNPKEYKRDIVVMNLNKKEFVLLILPTGSRLTVAKELKQENLPDGRKIVKIHSLQETKATRTALQLLIQEWISLVEKP
ncbi:MAG: DUF1801 domain-containing protein [Cyclobacteriaceae bacterium]|nr:DUF1801 domain-containing protein [Cyclobacteriaceae bacterium]